MNTTTPDPLPLSESQIRNLDIWSLLTDHHRDDCPQDDTCECRLIIESQQLADQAITAIKLKEENDALRKAGEEMAKLLFSFYMRTDYEEPDKNDRDTIQESLNDWRKVAGDAE